MRCLRRNTHNAIRIVRKSGVRSRIQKLHYEVETSPETMDFELLQPYDVADLTKQYFRQLPGGTYHSSKFAQLSLGLTWL